MNNKGRCCEAMVASAVPSPRSQRVLSRRIAERAFFWIVYTILGRITIRSRKETDSSGAKVELIPSMLWNGMTLAVRTCPALSFFI